MTAELNQRAAKNPALPASPPRQAFTPFSQVHMTWNNYLQSLYRWIQNLACRDRTTYTRWRHDAISVCREGRAIFLIGNGAGAPAMTTIANHHSIDRVALHD
ncbi:MAG: hypothetical protein QGF67_14845 [Lentisphaeria bacterium]|nr:hypothetical protein [Lentisphaeria bacterium]